jgi:hypothetical protein
MAVLELVLLISALTLAAPVSEPLTFESPLVPDHSDDWTVSGSAAPLRKYVRLTPPIGNRIGVIYANTQLTDLTFTIEAKFKASGGSATQNQGMAIWLSENDSKGFVLGSFYGADSTFRGVLVYLNASTKTIGGTISDRSFDLTHEAAVAGGSCAFDFLNKEMRLQVKAVNKKLKVSMAEDEAAYTLCFEVR